MYAVEIIRILTQPKGPAMRAPPQFNSILNNSHLMRNAVQHDPATQSTDTAVAAGTG